MNISNKRVAVVGSSRGLEGENLGEEIDSYDYVVKFNGALFLNNDINFCNDYGYKDDIHFLTNPFVKEMNPDLNKYSFVDTFLLKKDIKKYQKVNKVIIYESFKEVENKIEKGFIYSGIAVINYLLKFDLKELRIFGMDMYVDKPNYWDEDWSNYPTGYIPHKMKELTSKLHSDRHLAHSRYWNALILNNLIKDKRVVKDEILEDNIKVIINNKRYYE